MICTRCGTNNSKTSKYCRECGKRLIVESLELDVEQSEGLPEPPDDAAVSELLYEALKLYEQGKLDLSFAKCRESLGLNPNSPSGRSLLALIYEKKAEGQVEKGNLEDAEDYLRAAVRQIERVLEANPDSVADREKLDDLRAKLEGQARFVVKKRLPVMDQAKAQLMRVPLPWLAGGGTTLFLILVYLMASAVVGGKNQPNNRALLTQSPQQTQMPQQPQQQPQPAQAYPNTISGPAWTYQPPAAAAQQPATALPPQTYAPQPQSQYRPPDLSPLPSAQAQPVQPYPVESPPRPAPERAPRRSAEVKLPPAAPQASSSERARTAYASGDYQSAAALYEQAIMQGEVTAENHQALGMCLYNIGKKNTAVDHFEQAISLYSARKAKGIDADSADSGIRTCKLYIDLSKE